MPDFTGLLLQNNCAKEVGYGLPFGLKALSDSADVIPEWLPLTLARPDVGTLEQRDNQSLWAVEDVLGRLDLRVQSVLPQLRIVSLSKANRRGFSTR
jgi:hypothetical protein